jgi:hypothetical protein
MGSAAYRSARRAVRGLALPPRRPGHRTSFDATPVGHPDQVGVTAASAARFPRKQVTQEYEFLRRGALLLRGRTSVRTVRCCALSPSSRHRGSRRVVAGRGRVPAWGTGNRARVAREPVGGVRPGRGRAGARLGASPPGLGAGSGAADDRGSERMSSRRFVAAPPARRNPSAPRGRGGHPDMTSSWPQRRSAPATKNRGARHVQAPANAGARKKRGAPPRRSSSGRVVGSSWRLRDGHRHCVRHG